MSSAFVPSPVRGAHHVAFRCVDAEQTRWFYEDVLGLPLAAALAIDEAPGSGEQLSYLHLFFELGDGKYLAFFDAPGNARPDAGARKHSYDMHIALEVADEEELLAMQTRLQSHGKSCFGPVEHGFVRSVYMYDPNGIQVEVTYRTAQHDAAMAEEAAHARTAIAEWTLRTHEEKVALFGADKLKSPASAA